MHNGASGGIAGPMFPKLKSLYDRLKVSNHIKGASTGQALVGHQNMTQNYICTQ